MPFSRESSWPRDQVQVSCFASRFFTVWTTMVSPNKSYLSLLGVSQVALVIKNPPAHAGDIKDTGSILGCERFPGGGHGILLQCSCLENSMDRGAWWASVHGVTKSQTQLKQLSMHACQYCFFFYWSIVNLQCCIGFKCTAKWFIYTYLDILFWIFLF